jgi:hypothetical protein
MWGQTFRLFSFLLFVALPLLSFSQVADNRDPLSKMSAALEFGVLSHYTQAQLKFDKNSTLDDLYRLGQNPFRLNFDVFINAVIYNEDINGEFTSIHFKTGVYYQNRQTFLIDSNFVNLDLRERYLTFPVSIGFRIPQAYRTIKNEQFRANEFCFGINIGVPIGNVISEIDAPFSMNTNLVKQFVRFGFHLELAHTSYNAFGKGHRFGLRYQFDTPVIGTEDNASMKLVHYHSIGLFYNLINDRTLRRSVKK